MKISLTLCADQTISVQCTLPVRTPDFSFALLDCLQPEAFINNGTPVLIAAEEPCKLPFRPAMKKYTFTKLQPGELSFHYAGPLKGFFRFMQEDLWHLSFYNSWYPMAFDADTCYDVTLLHDDTRILINGDYDSKTLSWRYHAQHQSFSDCNILLYDPEACICIHSGDACMLFFDNQLSSLAPLLSQRYADILQFYEKLYGHTPREKRTIVFLPQKDHCPGAYIRDHLIVFGKITQSSGELLHILAHELGHAYGTGANTQTWEDWLNETHAEWSALLFTHSINPELFNQLMHEAKKRYKRARLTLKPDGDRRPNDVHTVGTLLYYDLFQRYGRNAIETLLKAYDTLPVKTTAHFLTALDCTHPHLAAEIRFCL